MFRGLLQMSPPSANQFCDSKKRTKYRKALKPWVDSIDYPMFEEGHKLFVRVTYFSHDGQQKRDVDNIFKILLDSLKGKLYKNDDDIVQLEGFRLDMENQDSDFDLEIDFEIGEIEIEPINTRTCLLIEVCQLPMQEEQSMIDVTWY